MAKKVGRKLGKKLDRKDVIFYIIVAIIVLFALYAFGPGIAEEIRLSSVFNDGVLLSSGCAYGCPSDKPYCVNGVCQPTNFECGYNTGNTCDDGDPCTSDVCMLGQCPGTPIPGCTPLCCDGHSEGESWCPEDRRPRRCFSDCRVGIQPNAECDPEDYDPEPPGCISCNHPGDSRCTGSSLILCDPYGCVMSIKKCEHGCSHTGEDFFSTGECNNAPTTPPGSYGGGCKDNSDCGSGYFCYNGQCN